VILTKSLFSGYFKTLFVSMVINKALKKKNSLAIGYFGSFSRGIKKLLRKQKNYPSKVPS